VVGISALVRQQIKATLSPSQRDAVKRAIRAPYTWWYGGDLAALSSFFGSDKESLMHYAKPYRHHFDPLRHRTLNLLEIGIGGYADPHAGGASLRVWKAYFPHSRIFGLDLHDKSRHDEDRIRTFRGSQADPEVLRRVAGEIGTIDIVIDDGSHYSEHVITTFKVLFPLLAPNGLYVVEDLQTSYWEEADGDQWGGARDLAAPHTSMNFFKRLVDGLNYEEFTLDGYEPTYFDRHIVSMHFYHNLLFVYKGMNHDGSSAFGHRYDSGARP
jgi:hypothetical protein